MSLYLEDFPGAFLKAYSFLSSILNLQNIFFEMKSMRIKRFLSTLFERDVSR